MNVRRSLITSLCLAAGLALAVPARAADFTWTASNGAGLSATAVFHDAGGGNLQITLTNNGSGDVNAPSQVLTAVLFNCSCGTLVPVSAISSGPTVNTGVTVHPTNFNVGGEWAYGGSTQNASGGSTRVITSMGAFNGVGDANFNGSNLQDPVALDGVEYGIVPSTENGTGNGGIEGQDLIQHDVVFTLSGFNGSMSFTGVSFQYGTALTETNLGGGTGSGGGSTENLVPEPTSLLLFGSGLAMTAYRARRKKNQKNS